MKSLIFYAVCPGKGCCGPYWPVYAEGGLNDTRTFVRAEVVEGSPEEALDSAQPRDGETVLNTILIP